MACFVFFISPKYLLHLLDLVNRLKAGLSLRQMSVGGGITISYTERGDITTCEHFLVLIHGFSSSKYAYSIPIGFLSKEYHIVAIDLPGELFYDD